MTDRESVITHLQIIHTWAEFARERDLQFFTAKHLEDIAKWADDALAMLKEQDAVVPGLMQDAKGIWNTCGKCGHILKSAFFNPMDENDTFFYYPKFCSECGRAVKWE